MTDAQDPGMAEAVREIDRVIQLRKGDLEVNAGELAETQARLTSLVDQAARLRLVIDALVAVRESLAPMPTPEADALEAVEPPLDVACPGCGADYGEPCRMFGAHDVPRGPHLIRRQASDAKAAGERMAANLIKSVAFHA